MPQRWITVANPEKSLLSGSQAVLSLCDLSSIDGRVAKEARIPFQTCHLEIYDCWGQAHSPQCVLSRDKPALQLGSVG